MKRVARFSRQVRQWIKSAELSIDQATRLVALKVHDNIVQRTPVDTGRARASWNIVAGEVSDKSVAPEQRKGGSLMSAVQLAMLSTTQKADPQSIPPAKRYTISNNLPYIVALENGHSKQAPSGMVKLAIAEVKAELDVYGKLPT